MSPHESKARVSVSKGSVTKGSFVGPFLIAKTSAVVPQFFWCLVILVVSVLLQISTAAPVTVDLTKFFPGTGARYTGTTDSQTARTVSFIGDHNGDGFEDYVVSCSNRNYMAVIVMKRNTTNVNLHIPDIVSGEYFRVVKGNADSNTGSTLAGLGDINSDGFDDVLIGCGAAVVTGRMRAGYAVVIFGKNGPFVDIMLTDSWPASSIGFTILGIVANTGFRGMHNGHKGIGDVNGDGINDFAVAAPFLEGKAPKYMVGVVWVIFGKAKGVTYKNIDLLPANFGSNGVHYTGASTGDWLGLNIMAAGDFNGDGIADILLGAPGFGITRSGVGAAYLIFGSKKGLANTDLSVFVTGAKGVRFLGAVENDQLGLFLSGVGDINGDGLDDIAIGAPGFDLPSRSGCGAVYVIYGNKDTYTADVDLANFAASIYGFVIYGRAIDMMLYTSSPAGDVNGDGVKDLLVGGGNGNSRAHIIYGQKEERTVDVDTFSADVMTFFYVLGASLGYGLHGGRDVTGDGIPDILMGANAATVTLEGSGTVLPNAGIAWMLPGPFNLPSAVPTTAPITSPTVKPSIAVTASPSALPTFKPSAVPSFAPSHMPSKTPSLKPSVLPSLQPSVIATSPTVDPTFMPSVVPTKVPTMQPSGDPSVHPSLSPSGLPTVHPTLAPSAYPTLNPSASPEESPTAVPTVNPTVLPSGLPTVNPSVSPTVNPTVLPSILPTVDPSASPTVNPTTMPTYVPSGAPTTFPTSAAVRDFELAVNVEQEVLFVTKEDYEAHKVAYNHTIQHTVADALIGVLPERVTDIVVEEEEEEEGGKLERLVRTTATSLVHLKYKITVFDSIYTVEKLRAQLVQAAQEGRMNENLRHYAAQFGAIGLSNGTFALPQVTNAAVQRDSSEQLTGVMIALLVIGVMMGLLFLLVVIHLRYSQSQTQSMPATNMKRIDMIM